MAETPITEEGLKQFDNLPPAEAILAAWNTPGPEPIWHEEAKRLVRNLMPVMARAIDRLNSKETNA